MLYVIAFAVGVAVGWNIEQPAWAAGAQATIMRKWEEFRSK